MPAAMYESAADVVAVNLMPGQIAFADHAYAFVITIFPPQ